MQKLLIIKANSRLGMKYIPIGGTELNIGVEHGPAAVLDAAFLGEIGSHADTRVIDFTFSLPEDVSEEKYYSIVASETDLLAGEILKNLNEGDFRKVITVGGDHSIALASMLGILRYLKGKKVGVIDFDSHGDIHLAQTSPTGNFHGMWLRPLLGDFDNAEIKNILDVRIPPQDFLYVGNLLLEGEESDFIRLNDIQAISSDDIKADGENIRKKISDFCARFDCVHVSFDIDVFKRDIVSATGTPNPDGFDWDLINRCIDPIIASKKLFSLDVVEVNPKKENARNTIETAQEIISHFCG